MFKKFINEILLAGSRDDLERISGWIDTSYQHEKISFKDHEILLDLICKVSNGDFTRAGVVTYIKEV